MKKTYTVKLMLTMIGTINIQAESEEMAEKIAYNKKITTSNIKNFCEDWREVIHTKEKGTNDEE
jgi:hypothetical protein